MCEAKIVETETKTIRHWQTKKCKQRGVVILKKAKTYRNIYKN